MHLPRLFPLRQRRERPRVEDPAGQTRREWERLGLAHRIRPGHRVAITAGSRGVANIPDILRAIVRGVRSMGGEPFLVPAMGSHGGGTVEGQLAVLRRLGVTESYCECPIHASMETVEVCRSEQGFSVRFDRIASEADHVVVCNRVKPHTNFIGDLESGLMKMMLIGLGKHEGARIYHRAIKDFSFGQIVRSVAREVLSRCNILAGVAIVENAYDETAIIEAIEPERIQDREVQLLERARELLPQLPFRTADLLLIDRFGKDVSGTGMDTNVVGRKRLPHRAAEDEFPKIQQIAVRSLTEATEGNATGLGLAEFCLTRVVEQRDARRTTINCLTGGHAVGAMIPVSLDTDREILESALGLMGLKPPEQAEIVWIRDTLNVNELACSEAYWSRAEASPTLEILGPPRPAPLNEAGCLPDDIRSAWPEMQSD